MKIEWLESGILQLQPESTEDVFKLADIVECLRKDDFKQAPSRRSDTPAQVEQPALQELPPEYGVTLSGSPENPIIENRSGRAVIAYTLKKAGQNGHGPAPLTLLAFSGQPAGIPDGGAVYANGNVPVNLAGQVQVLAGQVQVLSPFRSVPILPEPIRQEPIVTATLRCVVFGDGQFVGVEEEWVFEHFGKVMKVIVEVGLLAKAGAWDQLEALDFSSGLRLGPHASGGETYFERRLAAMFLVRERKQKGDAAAQQLAELYTSLPTLWK